MLVWDGYAGRVQAGGSSADRQASTQHTHTQGGVVVWWVFAIQLEQDRLTVALTNTSASKDASLLRSVLVS